MKATSKTARETILIDGKGNDANCTCRGAREQPAEPGPAQENEDDLIATALQEVITDEMKSQVANELETIPDMAEEAAKLLFRADNLSAQVAIRTAVYDAVEHLIIDLTKRAVLGETINKQVDK